MARTGKREDEEDRRRDAIGYLKGLSPDPWDPKHRIKDPWGPRSIEETARTLKVTKRSVYRWIARYKSGGKKALAAKKAPGRPAKLDNAALETLKRCLNRGARAFGCPDDAWTAPRAAAMIRDELGIRFHANHVGRILKSVGWGVPKVSQKRNYDHQKRNRQWIKMSQNSRNP